MADDDLLSRLGALVREEEQERDAELHKLVHGTLTPAEREELATRAANDPALARQVEQLTPVSDELRMRIVQQALAARTAQAPAPAARALHASEPAKVSELRPKKRISWLAPASTSWSTATRS